MTSDLRGWFSPEEGAWYAGFAAGARGGVLVEIGCWRGRSTSYVAPVCARDGTRLVCVDHFAGSRDAYARLYRETLAVEDVLAVFEQNARELGWPVELRVEPSVEAAARFGPASVDRVFLDASHDESSVAEDMRAWWPKLRARGALAGHDWSDEHPGLVRAVRTFAEERGLPVARPVGTIWAVAFH
jgi:predicted O-methyltransferase YrrM